MGESPLDPGIGGRKMLLPGEISGGAESIAGEVSRNHSCCGTRVANRNLQKFHRTTMD